MPGAKIRVRLSKKSRPADMCGWTGHLQGNLALRVCEPLCGECAVQRQILSPGGSRAKRVQWTKQRRRGWRSAPVFASAHRGALRKPAKRKRARGKEFLSRVCGQKWVPPGACRFCDTLARRFVCFPAPGAVCWMTGAMRFESAVHRRAAAGQFHGGGGVFAGGGAAGGGAVPGRTYLLSEEVKEAVSNNYLHIHDKDYYPTKSLTCVQHPLDRILKYGFSAGHGESRPAKRIETASILGCISLETAQNEMHGGQAIPACDFYLASYVRNSFIEEEKT